VDFYLLLARSNLVLQVVILALLLASYTFKRKGRFLSHGVLMLIALVLNLVSFALVMGPSLISLEPVIMMSALEKRSIVIVLHATFGSVADVLAVFILASWRLRPGTAYCIKRKKVMRMAFMFWLVALSLGILVYLLQYTDLFL